MVGTIGETFTVSSVSARTYNDRGDVSGITWNSFIVSGVVQQVAGDEDIVKEGILEIGDL